MDLQCIRAISDATNVVYHVKLLNLLISNFTLYGVPAVKTIRFNINVPLTVASEMPAVSTAAAVEVLHALTALIYECSGDEFFLTGAAPLLPRDAATDDGDVYRYLLVTRSPPLDFQAVQKFIAGCYTIAAMLPDGYLQLKFFRRSEDLAGFVVGPKAHEYNGGLFNRADFVDLTDAIHIMYATPGVLDASRHTR